MSGPWQLRELAASHRPGDWIRDALCPQVSWVDFFPGKAQSVEPAKRICRMCPVRVECAEYAVTSPIMLLGVWGGMSANERREVRQRRGIKDQNMDDVLDLRCGSEAGAKAHWRRGESPCEACRSASVEARRRRLEAQ